MDSYLPTSGTFTPFSESKFALTPERKTALMFAGGAAVGAAQTILLKKYMDGNVPSWYPDLSAIGGFGKPSALIGMATGAAAIGVGLFFLKDPKIRNIAVSYGGSALAGGILSGAGLV